MGYSKQPPEIDPEAASQYDLGYGEGSIQHSLAQTTEGTELLSDPSLSDPSIAKAK